MPKSIKIGETYHRPNSESLKRLKRKLRLQAKKKFKKQLYA